MPVLKEPQVPWTTWLPKQRWFGAKARPIARVTPTTLDVWGSDPALLLILAEVAYQDGGRDRYFVPLAVRGDRPPTDALADDAACQRLLEGLTESASEPLRTYQAANFADLHGPANANLAVGRGSGDQSNSAVRFGHRLLLKTFRRLEPGPNPDYEILRFLTERAHFPRVPPLAGALLAALPDGQETTLAILEGYVASEGNAWEQTLKGLDAYFATARAGQTPPLAPAKDAAALLGWRTAELHLALASDTEDPDFAPEPLTVADLAAVRRRIAENREQAWALLGEHAAEAPDVAKLQGAVPTLPAGLTKTRVHGDYHLGQVLAAGGDYVILDFEGEPARPLAERRAKHSPLKDVAGMVRSYHYAAYAALFQQPAEAQKELEEAAGTWYREVSGAFLKGYRDTAAGASFLPARPAEFEGLLKLYLLDKAMYELLYELNNRPDWVRIPLQGLRQAAG